MEKLTLKLSKPVVRCLDSLKMKKAFLQTLLIQKLCVKCLMLTYISSKVHLQCAMVLFILLVLIKFYLKVQSCAILTMYTVLLSLLVIKLKL